MLLLDAMPLVVKCLGCAVSVKLLMHHAEDKP